MVTRYNGYFSKQDQSMLKLKERKVRKFQLNSMSQLRTAEEKIRGWDNLLWVDVVDSGITVHIRCLAI